MGSLMAGWSTTPPCSKKVFKRTTSSLTRDEVKRYLRAKVNQSRQHLEEANRAALARTRSFMVHPELPEEDEDYFPDMSSISEGGSQPSSPTAYELGDETSKKCWWRRSNFAFLNEPPIHETKHNSYVAQFQVADVREKVPAMETSHAHRGRLHHTRSTSSIF